MQTLVYLNDAYVPAAEAGIAIYDAGLVQGATVTVQARTFSQRLWRLDERLDRLFEFLRAMHLDVHLSRSELEIISFRLIEHNGQLVDEKTELGLLIFVTAGEYSNYAASSGRNPRDEPTVCVHTFPLPFQRWSKRMIEGAHLIVPSVRQVPSACWSPQLKCRSRMHWYLADREVQRTDPQAMALLCDLDDHLTETNTGNLLLVRSGKLLSPLSEKILPGSSRAMVLELAEGLGIPYEELDLRVEDAIGCDEAFLTSTPYCILPVTRINNSSIGKGNRGRITTQLQEAWSAKVGVDIIEQFSV